MLPDERFETVLIKTQGDMDKVTPLSLLEGSDFFTREIEHALLEGSIDAAVHSAKDLEEVLPRQLILAAVTASISQFECLVSRGDIKLHQLSSGSIVGTSSRKRKEALSAYRADLEVRDIRGTIQERLIQLDAGIYDAIIVAHAALLRLELENRIAQIIPQEIIPAHPLQGRLAVEIHRRRLDLRRIFGVLHEA